MPDVMVPWDGGAIPMCWICAHLVTEHEHEIGAPAVNCGCTAEQIYPPDVLARRRRLAPVESPIVSGEIEVPDRDAGEDRSQAPWRDAKRARGYAISEGIRKARARRGGLDCIPGHHGGVARVQPKG